MKSGKEGRSPAWLSKDLLVELKRKEEMRRRWKQRHASWEEYRDGVGKAKAQLELNLARDVKKNHKKGFYRCVGQKRKTKENAPHPHPPPIGKTGELAPTDMEKAEALKDFSPPLSLAITVPASLKSLNLKAGTGGTKSLPS